MEPKNPKVGKVLRKGQGHAQKLFTSLVFQGEVSKIGETDLKTTIKKRGERRGEERSLFSLEV